MNYYVGVDIGHTKIKAGIFDVKGNMICMASQKTPFMSESIETEVLWQCIAKCVKKLIVASGLDKEKIKGISCSGHGNGLYLLDKNNKSMKNAYSATYSEGEEFVSNWKKSGKAEEINKYIFQDIWAGQPLSILAYLKERERELYENIGTVFFCKDYINYCLTDEIATDYTDTSAAGVMDNSAGIYNEKIFETVGLREMHNKLPPVKKSTDVIGYVSKKAAKMTGLKPGTVVAVGMFDVAASIVGTGSYKDGNCTVISGTWGINAIISKTLPEKQKFLQCIRFIDGEAFVNIESAPTSSVNLEWLLKGIFPDVIYKEADEIVQKFSADDVKMIYKPYIYGDLRNNQKGGAFLNLSYKDNKETMIRAVYEGVAMGHRKQLEALEESGYETDSIVFAGGAANSSVWCGIFADVLGKTLRVPKRGDAGILGNVMVASLAAGEFTDLDAVHEIMKSEQTVYYPDDNRKTIYDEKYRLFKQYQ